MKMAELKVGEEYAYSNSQSRYGQTRYGRVRVLEVGVHRRIPGEWRSRSSERADGVRVLFLDKETGKPKQRRDGYGADAVVVDYEDKVLPRYIHWSWAEEVERLRIAAERHEAFEIKQEERRAALQEVADRVNGWLGEDVFTIRRSGEGTSYSVRQEIQPEAIMQRIDLKVHEVGS
jgi:hypothetical protein